MTSSDSEDDFMSDKFLVDAAASDAKTYTQRREAEKLKSLRRGQAKNMPSLAQREKERRAEGLSKSLFDDAPSGSGGSAGTSGRTTGGNKAMEMMMKMGWKVGEGLGRRSKSPSPDREVGAAGGSGSSSAKVNEGDAPRGGIGSRPRGRVEPIRISLWAGRKGISARSPSPPPLPTSSGRNPDALHPEKLARLGQRTDDFRAFQKTQFAGKEVERKAGKAREMLVKLDEERGVKFHPLHVLPTDPLGTLPPPLLKLIYPEHYHGSPSPSPPGRGASPPPPLPESTRYISEAERTRERMRRDLLSDLAPDEQNGGDAVLDRKRKLGLEGDAIGAGSGQKADDKDYEGVRWTDMVSGTKQVLRMDPTAYLAFLLSQLRNEHTFCYWCGYKYGSFDEMDGPGGCPGEDEDDH